MWYRFILSARVVTDKEGERTIHQTNTTYQKPIWIFDDPNQVTGSAEGLGTGTQAFGPGHYTAQSPAVSKGYEDSGLTQRREEKLPKGTNIIHYDELLPEEKISIIKAANKELGKNIDINSDVKTLGDIGELFGDYDLSLIYPILLRMGYDAVEHFVGRNSGGSKIKRNEELMKTDPEYLDENGNLLEGKYRKHLKRSFDSNIIVINRAILTMPDLFQRVRFRPDSVTPEEMKRYRDEQQTTFAEYYENILQNPNAQISFLSLPKLLESGLDPKKLFERLSSDLNGSFKERFEVLKKIYKSFPSELISNYFDPSELAAHLDELRQMYGPSFDSMTVFDEAKANLQYLDSYYKWLIKYFRPDDKNIGKDWVGSYDSQWAPKIQSLWDAYRMLTEQPEIPDSFGVVLPYRSLTYLFYKLADYFSGQIEKFLKNTNIAKDLETNYPHLYEAMIDLLKDKHPKSYERLFPQSVNEQQPNESQETFIDKLKNAFDKPKFAYKITTTFTKTAGKVKYYFFNGESKPLKDHLQDIFPYANSVDIFYLADRVRKMALNDDDVSRVLYEAAVGHLFPRYEDKR
jgi:hypothetical protein